MSPVSHAMAILILVFSRLPKNTNPIRFPLSSLLNIVGRDMVEKDGVSFNFSLSTLVSWGVFAFNPSESNYIFTNRLSSKVKALVPTLERMVDRYSVSESAIPNALYNAKNNKFIDGAENLLSELEAHIYTKITPEIFITLELAIYLAQKASTQDIAAQEKNRFCDIVLRLQAVSLHRGKYCPDCLALFKPAVTILEETGNRRRLALLYLSKGCLEELLNRADLSAYSLNEGISIVKQIGDKDMLTQASAFLLPLYLSKGVLLKILACFDRIAEMESHRPSLLYDGTTSFFAGLAACHFHNMPIAVGLARSFKRKAEVLKQYAPSVLWAVQEAIVYFEKENHVEKNIALLKQLQKELDPDLETYLFFVVTRTLICGYARHNRLTDAYDEACLYAGIMERNGLLNLAFKSLWSMEVLYLLEQKGFPPVPHVDFAREVQQAIISQNPLLKGGAYRILALQKIHKGAAPEKVNGLLENSISEFDAAEHLFQCRISREMLKTYQASPEAVCTYNASLLHFVQEGKEEPEQDLLDSCSQMFELIPKGQPKNITLRKFARSLIEFFAGEHLFICSINGADKKIQASYNISEEEIQAGIYDEALFNLSLPERQGSPCIGREETRTWLVIPLTISKQEHWFLYVENLFTRGRYACFSARELESLKLVVNAELKSILQSCFEDKDAPVYYTRNPSVFLGTDIRSILDPIEQAASSDAPILLFGETGVGKEVIARHIHSVSCRTGAFVAVHPASTPETLFESEFFGHEKGAFTGADKQKIGFIEYAHNGTLFIDEVGEIPLSIQVKLLRVLQEKKFCRLGSITTKESNFRLVAATNRDLQEQIRRGKFREDLYYRLCVLPFLIPPLRERRTDCIDLASHFIKLFSKHYGKKPLMLSRDSEQRLLNYAWPGNVRELRNLIERSVILQSTKELNALPAADTSGSAIGSGEEAGPSFLIQEFQSELPTLKQVEVQYIEFVLSKTKGKISGPAGAGEILGIKPSTLYARLKKLGINLKRYPLN